MTSTYRIIFPVYQVEKAKEQARDTPAVEYTELRRDDAEEPIKLGLSLAGKKTEFKPPRPVKNLLSKDAASARPGSSSSGGGREAEKAGKRKLSALDEIKQFEEQKKEKMNRKDYWLSEVSS